MIENLPARSGAAALPAVSGPPTPDEWTAMKQQASVIAKSGLAPKAVSTPEKVLVIAMKGRELAVPPMQALSHIHIVEGKPTMSSELMVALVQRAGHRLRIIETNDEECIVEGVRSDDPDHSQHLTFTMHEAQQAGVAGKQNWKRYPAAMLRARAISALCRYAFADVLMGAAYTPEELGAEVNEEGEVVDTSGANGSRAAGRQEEPASQEGEVVEDPAGEVPASEPEIEEAEVVEDQMPKTSDPSAKVSNDQLRALRDAARDLYGQDGIREVQKKVGKQLHLLSAGGADKLLEQLNAAIEIQDEGDETSVPADGVDLSEEDIADIERMASGDAGDPADQRAQHRRDSSERPARKSQVDLLKTLAVELRGEDGVGRLEKRIGKPLEELTRSEADDWIEALTPEERE